MDTMSMRSSSVHVIWLVVGGVANCSSVQEGERWREGLVRAKKMAGARITVLLKIKSKNSSEHFTDRK